MIVTHLNRVEHPETFGYRVETETGAVLGFIWRNPIYLNRPLFLGREPGSWFTVVGHEDELEVVFLPESKVLRFDMINEAVEFLKARKAREN